MRYSSRIIAAAILTAALLTCNVSQAVLQVYEGFQYTQLGDLNGEDGAGAGEVNGTGFGANPYSEDLDGSNQWAVRPGSLTLDGLTTAGDSASRVGASGRASLWRLLGDPTPIREAGDEVWFSAVYDRTSTGGTDVLSIGSASADVNQFTGQYADDANPATANYGYGVSIRGSGQVAATTFTEGDVSLDGDTSFVVDASGGADRVLIVGRVRIDLAGGTDRVDLFGFRSGDPLNFTLAAPASTTTGAGDTSSLDRVNFVGSQENTFDELRIASREPGESVADVLGQVLPGLTLGTLDVNEQLPTLLVNRQTGQLSLRSSGTGDLQIKSYTIESDAGALLTTRWDAIADTDSDWDASATPALGRELLTESNAVGATTLVPGTPLGLGNAYLPTPIEDLTATITLADDSVLEVLVGYEGAAITTGDLDADGDVDAGDWAVLRSNFGATVGGLPDAASYRMGNLDSNNSIDFLDVALFRDAFDTVNTPGAFLAMISASPIPEPTSIALLAGGVIALVRRRRCGAFAAALLALGLITAPREARAVLAIYEGFQYNETLSNTAVSLNGVDGTGAGEVNAAGLVGAYLSQNANVNRQFQVDTGSLAFGSLTTAGNHTVRGERNNFSPASRSIDAALLPSLTADGGEVWFSYLMDPTDSSTTPNGQGNTGFGLASTSFVVSTNAEINMAGEAGAGVRVGNSSGVDAALFGETDSQDAGAYNLVAQQTQLIIGRIQWGDTSGDNDMVDLFVLGDAANIPATINLDSPDSTLTGVTDNSVIDTLTFQSNNQHRFDEFRVAYVGAGQTSADVLSEVTPGLGLAIDTAEPITLVVENNGELRIENNTGSPIAMAGYEIRSSSRSLNPDGWDSLQDQDRSGFQAGDGSGNGWEELGIAGDYSGDGRVDAIDYALWREAVGTNPPSGTGADGTADGEVDEFDYHFWLNRYGDSRERLLAEAFAFGESTLNDSESLDLGQAFKTNGVDDLAFRVFLADGTILIGDVDYPPALAPFATPTPEPTALVLLLIAAPLGRRRR